MSLKNVTEKLKFFTYASATIGIISASIKYLLDNEYIIYKEKLVSIPLLLPYNKYFLIAVIIPFFVFFIYFARLIYRFFKGKSIPDSLSVFSFMILISLPVIWSGTLKLLSEPLPVFDFSVGLLLFIPLSIYVTKLSSRVLKITFE